MESSLPASKAIGNLTTRQPKFHFSLSNTRVVSYADLYENHISNDGLQEILSSVGSEKNHSYTYLMRSMIERLENFGDLATVHQNKKIKIDPETSCSSSEKSAGVYDLADEFIDDAEVKDISLGDEEMFEKAVKEGFYVEYLEKAISVGSSSQFEFKRKRKDFGEYDDVIYSYLEELIKISKDSTASGIPKKAYPALLNLGEIILKHENIDAVELYEEIGKILSLNINSTQKAIEKLIKQKEKTEMSKKLNNSLKAFKDKIISESRADNFKINHELKSEFSKLLDTLEKFVTIKNSFSEKFMKYAKKVNYNEEEAKIIGSLNTACNDKINFKDLTSKENTKRPNGYGTVKVPLKSRLSAGNDLKFEAFASVKCEDID